LNPKNNRDKLFKNITPLVRPISIEDMRWIYGAHKLIGGTDEQKEFADKFANQMERYPEVFIIEDRNSKFKGKWGPVCLVPCIYNGWRLEPELQWFPWARNENRIRSTVAFLLYCRYSRDIGITLLHIPDRFKTFFRKIKKYVTLYQSARVPGGLQSGNDNIFYVRGKKKHGLA